jgi:hypothetical protein
MRTPEQRFKLLHRGEVRMLDHTIVKRRGITAKKWYGQTDVVLISRSNHTLNLDFDLPAKGGGKTRHEVCINSENFPTLLAFMSAIDRQAALKAMAEELRFQICHNGA